jgi:hypothetical protein
MRLMENLEKTKIEQGNMDKCADILYFVGGDINKNQNKKQT